MPAKFRWCAYVSDYPPHAEATSGNNYTLHGSPPFEVNGTKLGSSVKSYSGTITALTDATGAPGIFPAAAGQQPNERGCAAGLVVSTTGICITPAETLCNTGTFNFGTVSFTAGSEITIVGNGISQIWSRPVTAIGCQKNTYNGGSTFTPNVDCRTASEYAGDYFSGCAVMRYAGVLCPAPWRVPTRKDFINLDIAMGGSGVLRSNDGTFIIQNYMGKWAGQLAGIYSMNNTLYSATWEAWYHTLNIRNGTENTMNDQASWTNDKQSPWIYYVWPGVGGSYLAEAEILRCVR
jgi:hypothetical protein